MSTEPNYVRLEQYSDNQVEPFVGQSIDVESSAPQVLDGEYALEPIAVSSSSSQNGLTAPVRMDKNWATAFKVNVLITVISAISFGDAAIRAITQDMMSADGRRRLLVSDSGSADSDDESNAVSLLVLFAGGLVTLGLAVLVAVGMLHSLVNCGEVILFTSYGLFAAIWGLSAMVLAVVVHPLAAIVPAVVCILIVRFVYKRQDRISFGAANLKVAALAIKTMPWTVRSAVLMAIVQFFWCLAAGIAAFGSYVTLETVTAPDGTSYRALYCVDNMTIDEDGVAKATSGCVCNGDNISDGSCEYSGLGLPLTVVWILSMAWGCSVIRNVVAATVTGSVASWWFRANEDSAPVKGAFHRATRSSFGSLCKAGVVETATRVFYGLAQRVLRFIPCAAFILTWAQRAVNYVLAYTVCFIGIYGLTFTDASKRVLELFTERGVTTVANDVIVSVGLSLLAISSAVIYAVLSGSLMSLLATIEGRHEGNVDSLEFWSIMGPLVFGVTSCVLLISTLLEVVKSGFKAVFVCFVQDPEALAQKHDPEVHHGLTTAWEEMQIRSNTTTTVRGNSSINQGRVN